MEDRWERQEQLPIYDIVSGTSYELTVIALTDRY